MISKNKKIAIIVVSLLILAVIGFVGWNYIDAKDSYYSVNELKKKYPTVEELRNAVDSGEINYNKLPDNVKEMLKNYKPLEEIYVLPELGMP